MLICVQGRATEAPKPPQTQPQRRNFLVVAEADHPAKAEAQTRSLLETEGFGFVTVNKVYRVNNPKTGDAAFDNLVDSAQRNGVAMAIYR